MMWLLIALSTPAHADYVGIDSFDAESVKALKRRVRFGSPLTITLDQPYGIWGSDVTVEKYPDRCVAKNTYTIQRIIGGYRFTHTVDGSECGPEVSWWNESVEADRHWLAKNHNYEGDGVIEITMYAFGIN